MPGPCPPPELKASRRAAKYLQAIQRDAPTEIPPLADPLTPEQQAAQNASVNAALLAAGAGGGGAGGAAAAGAGAGAGGPTTTLSFAGKITPAGPLVVPSAGQSVRRVDRAAVRKSLLDAKQAPANATSASVAGAVTPKALYSQLYVRRACGEAADLWFAASWIPYGYSTWVTQGWWRIPNDGGAVYFGNTANRYFYIYAYAQQCAWGRCGLRAARAAQQRGPPRAHAPPRAPPRAPSRRCASTPRPPSHAPPPPAPPPRPRPRCCNTLRWSGSTSIRIGYYNYGFIKYDFGGYINPTYTVVLSCACRFMFCFTAPCCRCC